MLLLDQFQGSLLGGAVGDALGAPVDSMSLAAIRDRFGPKGIRELSPAYEHLGAITHNTQGALSTAEGLLRVDNRGAAKGICHPPTMVYFAYLRWLLMQGKQITVPALAMYGWLVTLPGLRAKRGSNASQVNLKAGRARSLDHRQLGPSW